MKNTVVKQVSAGDCEVIMFLHTRHALSREEWNESLALIGRCAKAGDFRRLRVLVVSDGGGPDATQRAELQELFKRQDHLLKTSVMLTSVIARGIVAAVSWFNPHIKSFSPRQFGEALSHLGLPSATAPRLLHEFSEMQRELSPVSCLALIVGSSAAATL